MFKLIIIIMFFARSAVSANETNCNLYPEFKTYMKLIYEKSRIDDVIPYFDMSSFKKSIPEFFDEEREEGYTDLEIELKSEVIMMRSMWVDSRIVEVLKYTEVCDKGNGELLLNYQDIYNRNVYEILPFILTEDGWKRGPPHISKRSNILGDHIQEVLK